MEKFNEVVEDLGLKLNSNLEKEFKESLKDENFKELVSKIKLPKEKLMKYTSLLEQSACDYANCSKCKSLLACKNKIEGHAYLPKIVNERLVFSYKACKYQERLNEANKYRENITLYQTRKDILDANKDGIDTKDAKRHEVIKWLTEFTKSYPINKKGLYLHGNFGCGKTYLVTAFLVELAKKGVKSTIVFWPEFLTDLKSYFGDDIGYKRIMHQMKNTEILFIDDIGAENLTVWARDEVLCPIIQYRMDNNLTTFFTSNFDIKDLEKHLASTKEGNESVKARRIIERIKQLTVDIELLSKNLRN